MEGIVQPLKLVDGSQVRLIPGKHHELQIAIIDFFGPRFASGSSILYLGDTFNKPVIYERELLEQLGVPTSIHDKLPDILLYRKGQNWLYLIKTVTYCELISHNRFRELEESLEGATAKRVYVSAFSNRTEYRRYASHIAWGTTVWIAAITEHLIHYV